MGYYSDVRFATNKAGFEEFKASLDEGVYRDWFDDGVIDAKGESVVFGWDYVKWYPSNPEVFAIMNAYHAAAARHPFQYVCVGEGYDHQCDDVTYEDNTTFFYRDDMPRTICPVASIKVCEEE